MLLQKRKKACGLCGAFGQVTQEHFCPQCLWVGSRPNLTLTVPACDQCNAGSNLDDEYFRNTSVMMFDLDHPTKKKLFPEQVLRSLKQHPGRLRHALANAKVKPLFTPSGLWLGDFPVLPIEIMRYNRSLFKIVKGLYYALHKKPFPSNGRISVIGQMNAQTMPLVIMLEKSFSLLHSVSGMMSLNGSSAKPKMA